MAMQLRSGRRPASPPAPSGGVRQARPRRSDAADGEDRISDLPKELRLEVLQRLGCAREATRTSVLSSRWCGLWTELRDLNFNDVGDPDSLATALATVSPGLNRLRISDGRCAYDPWRISSLLRAADRLAPVELDVTLRQGYSYSYYLEIPCFGRATSIDLCIHGLDGMLPPAGQFAALEQLSLGKGFLDPLVLVQRCPRLRKLDMEMCCLREFCRLTIESKSLEEPTWRILEARRPEVDRIVVVAPKLKNFRLFSHTSGEFTVSLSAQKLEEFHLEHRWEYSRVRSGRDRWHLCELKMATEWSSRHGPGQLQNVRVHVLSLTILNILNGMKSLSAKRSIEQEVARLPVTDFSVLELCLCTEGHVFGALVLQLLRIRTTIQRLKVVRLKDKFPDRCFEYCDCDEANWRNEPLSLLDLEVVEFEGLHGEDHELDFLHLLFGSAPMLKRMRVELFDEDSLASGACQKLQSIFAANASVECSIHAKSG